MKIQRWVVTRADGSGVIFSRRAADTRSQVTQAEAEEATALAEDPDTGAPFAPGYTVAVRPDLQTDDADQVYNPRTKSFVRVGDLFDNVGGVYVPRTKP